MSEVRYISNDVSDPILAVTRKPVLPALEVEVGPRFGVSVSGGRPRAIRNRPNRPNRPRPTPRNRKVLIQVSTMSDQVCGTAVLRAGVIFPCVATRSVRSAAPKSRAASVAHTTVGGIYQEAEQPLLPDVSLACAPFQSLIK